MNSITRSTIQSFCRICLVNIEDYNTKTYNVEDVKELLFECTGVICDCFDEELLPKKICSICHTHLQGFNKFQQLAKLSLEYLKELLEEEEAEDDTECNVEQKTVHHGTTADEANKENVVERVFVTAFYDKLKFNLRDLNNKDPLVSEQVVSQSDRQYDTEADGSLGLIEEGEQKERETSNQYKKEEIPPSCEDSKQISSEKEEACIKMEKLEFIEVPIIDGQPINKEKINDNENMDIPEINTCEGEGNASSKTNGNTSSSTRQKNRKIFQCCECPRTFKGRGYLMRHISLYHSASSEAKERKCSEYVLNMEKLEFIEVPIIDGQPINKEKINDNENMDIPEINTCEGEGNATSKTNGNTSSSTRQKNRKIFQCYECPRTFNGRGYLKRHINFYHSASSEAKERKCSERPTKFKNLANLEMNFQLGARDYQCKTCGEKFKTSNNLCRHEVMTYCRDFTFVCKHCNGMFRQHQGLSRHMKQRKCTNMKSGKEGKSHQQQNHIELHSSAAHLYKHDQLVHIKPRLYRCSECDKAFSKSLACFRHELTHSKVATELYKCSECNKAFSNASVCYNHELKHKNR